MFPQPRARFFGRTEDLAHLAELCASGTPVVTLWGPPGIGKTRLAIEVGRRTELRRAGQPAATWFCELASADGPADICAAVLRALDVKGQPTRDARRIGTVLAAR